MKHDNTLYLSTTRPSVPWTSLHIKSHNLLTLTLALNFIRKPFVWTDFAEILPS